MDPDRPLSVEVIKLAVRFLSFDPVIPELGVDDGFLQGLPAVLRGAERTFMRSNRFGTGLALAVLIGSLIAAALPSPVRAQAHLSNVRLAGLRAGIAISSTRLADQPELPAGESVAAPTLGVFGRVPLGGNIAGQAELLYLRQGVNFGELEIRYTVLRLPVTIQVLIPAGGAGLRVFAGGTIDLPLSCSQNGLDGCLISRGESNVGLTGGVLVDLPLGASVLTLDFRYDHGLSELESRGFGFPDLEGFRGFEMTVGIGLPNKYRKR